MTRLVSVGWDDSVSDENCDRKLSFKVKEKRILERNICELFSIRYFDNDFVERNTVLFRG